MSNQTQSKEASEVLPITTLIQLPRPGSGTPSPNGTVALWPSSTFDLSSGRTDKTFYLIDLTPPPPPSNPSGPTPAPKKLIGGLSYTEHAWLDDHTLLFLRPPFAADDEAAHVLAENGERKRGLDHPVGVSDKEQKERLKGLMKSGATAVEIWALDTEEGDEYLIGALPVEISNLKLLSIPAPSSSSAPKSSPTAILAFSAVVFPDGDPYTVADQEDKLVEDARGSDVRVYDKTFVRHWDTWTPTAGQLNQVHFVKLTKSSSTPSIEEEEDYEVVSHPPSPASPSTPAKEKWTVVTSSCKSSAADNVGEKNLKKITIWSPLAGTGLECPVGPFGSSSDFDLSPTHLIFHAKDPHLNPAWHTRTQVYIVPLSPKSKKDGEPKILTVGNQGACTSPRFSVDGTRASWLEMREDGYESDRNRVMIYEIETSARWGATENWEFSPGSLEWCPCGEKVYLIVDHEGRNKLFQLPVPLPSSGKTALVAPSPLTQSQSISSISPLTTSTVLITSSSFTHPNVLSLLSVSSSATPSLSPLPALVPPIPSLSTGESFWYSGTGGHPVHGFILHPPSVPNSKEDRKEFLKDKAKKFPLAFLVHGGPQGSWQDAWSTRWNPNVYASHGYVTVVINPTGSTGYGQPFTDAIKNNWGGSPFTDLVAGLHYLLDTYPEIDPERTAMLGASYGGFMANWIQGHNDLMGFKAIVCHDGVFSTTATYYNTEELYFPEREFGGTPWDVPDNYARWNPQNHISKWRTPQLIIHGGKDFRLTESEGLGVFNTLQRLGVPSRLVYFESENHWVLNPYNGVRWHEEVLKWIDEWTASSPSGAEQKKEAAGLEGKKGYRVGYVHLEPTV